MLKLLRTQFALAIVMQIAFSLQVFAETKEPAKPAKKPAATKVEFNLKGFYFLAIANSDVTLEENLKASMVKEDFDVVMAYLKNKGLSPSEIKMNEAVVTGSEIFYGDDVATVGNDGSVVVDGQTLKIDPKQSPAKNFIRFFEAFEGKRPSYGQLDQLLFPSANARSDDSYHDAEMIGGGVVTGAAGWAWKSQLWGAAKGAVNLAGRAIVGTARLGAAAAAWGWGIAAAHPMAAAAIGVAAVGYSAYEAYWRYNLDGVLTCTSDGRGHKNYDFNFVSKDSWWLHANFKTLRNLEPWRLQALLYGTCAKNTRRFQGAGSTEAQARRAAQDAVNQAAENTPNLSKKRRRRIFHQALAEARANLAEEDYADDDSEETAPRRQRNRLKVLNGVDSIRCPARTEDQEDIPPCTEANAKRLTELAKHEKYDRMRDAATKSGAAEQ